MLPAQALNSSRPDPGIKHCASVGVMMAAVKDLLHLHDNEPMDPSRKLIIYTLRSIWSYSFFKNDIKNSVWIINRSNHSIAIVLPIELPIVLPIAPTWSY